MKTGITYKFAVIVIAVLCLFSCLMSGGGVAVVHAAASSNTAYTEVLDDLKKDEKFNVADYPANSKDYSLQVIQIAESVNGELFVYIYQPCTSTQDLKATSINISTAINASLSYDNYELTRLSAEGVFGKYRVEGFELKKDVVRYYDISSVYRAWNPRIDGILTNGQTVSEKAYAVGQRWTACTLGGEVTYTMSEIEVIEVTNEMVGFRRYSEGFKFQGTYSCDAHFLAFSANHKIDKLISANVQFYTQDYKAMAGSGTTYESKVKHNSTLYDYEKAGTNSDGWFNGGDYVWDRMSSTIEFCASMLEQGSSMTNEEIETLIQYDWILCFYETDYICEAGGKDVLISCLLPFGFIWTIVNACTTTGTIVSDVTLMRLEFETDNVVYNLGVVSDKQTGSQDPTGEENFGDRVKSWWDDLWDSIKNFFSSVPWWAWIIVGFVVVILIVVIVSMIIPAVGRWIISLLKSIIAGLWWLIRNALYGLWWLITSPVRLLVWIVKKVRGRKDE